MRKKGDIIRVHCCDNCVLGQGIQPKTPADSGVASRLCEVCGHLNIGSTMDCLVGDWLRLRVLASLPSHYPDRTATDHGAHQRYQNIP